MRRKSFSPMLLALVSVWEQRDFITLSTIIHSFKCLIFRFDFPSSIDLVIKEINNPAIIKQNPKVTAINSCIEIDLTGQVCADSIGAMIFSGVGGQVDCK